MKNDLITQFCYTESEQPPHDHYHLNAEMIFVKAGRARFRIGRKEYTAQKGSVVFISSYEPHEVQILEKPYCRYYAMVNAPELERRFSGFPFAGILKDRPAGFVHCVSPKEPPEKTEQIFAQLKEELESDEPYADRMIQNLLEQLLIAVFRSCPRNFAAQDDGSEYSIREVQQYIEQHFTEELYVADLAERFFLNQCYLIHIFKKQVGYSPKQYILLNRLAYAKELLETTGLQINQISGRCGFGDVNNFIRSFRSWNGVTPNQYRRRRDEKAGPEHISEEKQENEPE